MDIRTLRAHADEGLPFRVRLDAVNKGIGVTALCLPFALLLTGWLGATCPGIDSISHFYYTRLGGDLLVGALFFIGLQMAFFYDLPSGGEGTAAVDGYLGHRRADLIAARLAGVAAFGVALVPASGPGCEAFAGTNARVFLTGAQGGNAAGPVSGTAGFDFWATLGIGESMLSHLHYGAAAAMFLVLAWFALVVFPRPQSPASYSRGGEAQPTKRRRNLLYRVCGGLILLAIVALGGKSLLLSRADDPAAALAGWNRANLTFWFEALGLVAFGVAWCVKGRLFGILRDLPA